MLMQKNRQRTGFCRIFFRKLAKAPFFAVFQNFQKERREKRGRPYTGKGEVMSVCRKKHEKFGLFIIGLAVGILLSVMIPDTVVIFLLAGLCLVVGILLMR